MPIDFYDIYHPAVSIPIETAVKMGQSCIPAQIPLLPDSLIYKNPPPSFREVAFETARLFFSDVIPDTDLYTLIAESFPFKVPVFPIDPRTYILELTHGNSGSCTDFGARFTAQLTAYFRNGNENPVHILFSGQERQTLSLAKAFAEHEQLDCTFLYPKGSFTAAAEQQLLALPQHIHTFAVEGTLDDCERMIRAAQANERIQSALEVFIPHESSAAYLLAYTFCCIYASLAVLSRSSYDNSIEMPRLIMGFPLPYPAGIAAAVLAQKMNAPIAGFMTATDASLSSPQTQRGYEQLTTILDGINPAAALVSSRLTQQDILEAMRTCNDRTGVIIGPEAGGIWHIWNTVKSGANASGLPCSDILTVPGGTNSTIPPWGSNHDSSRSCISIIAETSHPALHTDTVKAAIGREPLMPYRFEYNPQYLRQPVSMQAFADALTHWLLSLV